MPLWLLQICCFVQVVAYDFGIKHNILRRLASYGCSITVVPADYPADKVMAMNPDGVFFSNGPVSRAWTALRMGMGFVQVLLQQLGSICYQCLRIR
jgi:carbamoylphosphate synthase small subunit